jgi:hypothetical protein
MLRLPARRKPTPPPATASPRAGSQPRTPDTARPQTGPTWGTSPLSPSTDTRRKTQLAAQAISELRLKTVQEEMGSPPLQQAQVGAAGRPSTQEKLRTELSGTAAPRQNGNHAPTRHLTPTTAPATAASPAELERGRQDLATVSARLQGIRLEITRLQTHLNSLQVGHTPDQDTQTEAELGQKIEAAQAQFDMRKTCCEAAKNQYDESQQDLALRYAHMAAQQKQINRLKKELADTAEPALNSAQHKARNNQINLSRRQLDASLKEYQEAAQQADTALEEATSASTQAHRKIRWLGLVSKGGISNRKENKNRAKTLQEKRDKCAEDQKKAHQTLAEETRAQAKKLAQLQARGERDSILERQRALREKIAVKEAALEKRATKQKKVCSKDRRKQIRLQKHQVQLRNAQAHHESCLSALEEFQQQRAMLEESRINLDVAIKKCRNFERDFERQYNTLQPTQIKREQAEIQRRLTKLDQVCRQPAGFPETPQTQAQLENLLKLALKRLSTGSQGLHPEEVDEFAPILTQYLASACKGDAQVAAKTLGKLMEHRYIDWLPSSSGVNPLDTPELQEFRRLMAKHLAILAQLAKPEEGQKADERLAEQARAVDVYFAASRVLASIEATESTAPSAQTLEPKAWAQEAQLAALSLVQTTQPDPEQKEAVKGASHLQTLTLAMRKVYIATHKGLDALSFQALNSTLEKFVSDTRLQSIDATRKPDQYKPLNPRVIAEKISQNLGLPGPKATLSIDLMLACTELLKVCQQQIESVREKRQSRLLATLCRYQALLEHLQQQTNLSELQLSPQTWHSVELAAKAKLQAEQSLSTCASSSSQDSDRPNTVSDLSKKPRKSWFSSMQKNQGCLVLEILQNIHRELAIHAIPGTEVGKKSDRIPQRNGAQRTHPNEPDRATAGSDPGPSAWIDDQSQPSKLDAAMENAMYKTELIQRFSHPDTSLQSQGLQEWLLRGQDDYSLLGNNPLRYTHATDALTPGHDHLHSSNFSLSMRGGIQMTLPHETGSVWTLELPSDKRGEGRSLKGLIEPFCDMLCQILNFDALDALTLKPRYERPLDALLDQNPDIQIGILGDEYATPPGSDSAMNADASSDQGKREATRKNKHKTQIYFAHRLDGSLEKIFKNESFSRFEPFKERLLQYWHQLIKTVVQTLAQAQDQRSDDIYTMLEGSLHAFLEKCAQNTKKGSNTFEINLLAKDDAVFTHNLLTSAEKMLKAPEASSKSDDRSAAMQPLANELAYAPFGLVVTTKSGAVLRWPDTSSGLTQTDDS